MHWRLLRDHGIPSGPQPGQDPRHLRPPGQRGHHDHGLAGDRQLDRRRDGWEEGEAGMA